MVQMPLCFSFTALSWFVLRSSVLTVLDFAHCVLKQSSDIVASPGTMLAPALLTDREQQWQHILTLASAKAALALHHAHNCSICGAARHTHTHTGVPTHTRTHVHALTRTHVHALTRTHACAHTYSHKCARLCTQARTHTYTCTCPDTYIHMCEHIYIYTHKHTITHVHAHTHTLTYTHSHAHMHMHAKDARMMGFAKFSASLSHSYLAKFEANDWWLVHALLTRPACF